MNKYAGRNFFLPAFRYSRGAEPHYESGTSE
jgi:hypothetical protein